MGKKVCGCGGTLFSVKISSDGVPVNCLKCRKCGQLLVSRDEAFKFLSYRI